MFFVSPVTEPMLVLMSGESVFIGYFWGHYLLSKHFETSCVILPTKCFFLPGAPTPHSLFQDYFLSYLESVKPQE